jgi:hypothetical protein
MRLLRLVVVLLSISIPLFAAESPFSGTWKFNPSKGDPIPPVMKSSTARIDADEENFKLNQDFTDEKGQSSNVTFEAKFDGKDYPVTGDPDTDSVSLHRVSQREVILTFKKGGKIVFKNTAIVSRDGKTTTLNVTDYSEGKPKTGTEVYDKQ